MSKPLPTLPTLPIDVVNMICEWAGQKDVDWIPHFCRKTGNMSWKVNKHSNRFNEMVKSMAMRYCIEAPTTLRFPHFELRGIGRVFILERKGYFQMLDPDRSTGDFLYQCNVTILPRGELALDRFWMSSKHTIYLNATIVGEVWDMTVDNAYNPPDMTFDISIHDFY